MRKSLSIAGVIATLLIIGVAFGGGFLSFVFSGMAGPDAQREMEPFFFTILLLIISSVFVLRGFLKLFHGKEIPRLLIGILFVVNIVILIVPVFPAGDAGQNMSILDLFRDSTGI